MPRNAPNMLLAGDSHVFNFDPIHQLELLLPLESFNKVSCTYTVSH